MTLGLHRLQLVVPVAVGVLATSVLSACGSDVPQESEAPTEAATTTPASEQPGVRQETAEGEGTRERDGEAGRDEGGGREGDTERDGGAEPDRSEKQPQSDDDAELPPYRSRIRKVGPALRERMTGVSHEPGTCPVGFADLRRLSMSYVGFDGRHHTGEMIVNRAHARDVVGVFERLYDARWPIRRMRLIHEYAGNDNRSMAANNTSAYNCRRVAGQSTWSQHAYGAAVDVNPVQNPYLTGDGVLPPRGRRFADVDRSPDATTEKGVIKRGDVVMRAFRDIGWSWGGDWSQPDYQHFVAP